MYKRYQLIHRAASALLHASNVNTKNSIMPVYSLMRPENGLKTM
ncbi:DUF6946 family protein [Pseudoneobacillus rhizosphaerae]